MLEPDLQEVCRAEHLVRAGGQDRLGHLPPVAGRGERPRQPVVQRLPWDAMSIGIQANMSCARRSLITATSLSPLGSARSFAVDRFPEMPRLLSIIASTRPARIGLPVANWFVERAAGHGGFELDVVDLAELNLPLLDEPNHPRLRQYTKEHSHAWSAIVDAADAIVMVTSEYNHGYPAALKNAIDFLHHEWRYKPVGFVSYGGVAAGTRAVQQLKQVVTAVAMMPMQASVNIPFVQQFLGEDGTITANEVMLEAVPAMLDELLRFQQALAPLRA
jgi:NAD(P)H-dependent FMN reductase